MLGDQSLKGNLPLTIVQGHVSAGSCLIDTISLVVSLQKLS